MTARLALALLLALPAAARAASTGTFLSPAEVMRPAEEGGPHLSPFVAGRLEEGVRRLYALDYEKSRAAFHDIIAREPENPFGYLFEAGGIWWEASQEYGLFRSTPALQGLFEADIDAAVEKAEPMILSKDPRARADGYFVSGMALGTLGQWRLMKYHWLDAYFAGKKAISRLKKCVKLDPDYNEAYLGLGVFDYQAANLSGVARLGYLFGLRGDERRGLERIRRAMDKSRYARMQAAEFLSQLYILDRRDYASALAIVHEMGQEYPDAVYFVYLEAFLRARLGDRPGSLAAARRLYALYAADPDAFRSKWLTLACGLTGSDCLSSKTLAELRVWLDGALAATAEDPPGAFRARLFAERGRALDALGLRPEAEADYRAALALPDVGRTHALARACLASPCAREDILARLRADSRADAP
jgi:tetratricopeptide (TPR) repeat protein